MIKKNLLSLIVFSVCIVVLSIYITREISKNTRLEKKLDEIEQINKNLQDSIKIIKKNVKERDRLLLEQINNSYKYIEELDKGRERNMRITDSLQIIINTRKENLDKLLNKKEY